MDQARLGRYELIAQLATGGMGRVSLGKSRGEGGFERHVVIKSLDAVDVDDREATAMFLDEARILGMLHHQHVAAIQEVGRDDSGRLFLVLEYVHGHSAHDVWERSLDLEVHLPLDFTLTIIAAVASGLHYAHTKRSPDGEQLHIVHRDVTLSNVMIGFDGAVKVIDFGIAKAALRETKTKSGFIKGKIGYMAPEQLRGQHLDARTDVFSLGIVLYELTTMRRAFREISDRATVERIKNGRYTRPSEIVPDYPPGLEAIVMKALKVDPKQRFADADAMRIAVEGLGHELRLVVGDAAVVDTMMRLFPNRAEPWERRATTRAETESAIEVEWEDPHIGITREAPPGALQSLLSRTDTPPDLAIPEAHNEFVSDSMPTRTSTNPLAENLPPPPPPPPEPEPVLKSRRQHESVEVTGETTGEMMSPPTFLEPELRAPSDTDDVELGAVISSLEFDPKTAPTAVPLPEALAEPEPPPAPAPNPEPKTEPRGAVKRPPPALTVKVRPQPAPKAPKTAFIRAQKPSRSRLWLFIGTLIVAVSIAAAVLIYLYDQKHAKKKHVVDPPPNEPTAPTASGTNTAPMPSFPTSTDAAEPAHDAGAGSAVAPGPVHVRITSTPSDATVLLDGERLGHTPFEGDKMLAPGEHVIKLRLRGYAPEKRTIQLISDGIDEAFAMRRGN
jgi:eukaryotic-like serine/threonine-protein kinase